PFWLTFAECALGQRRAVIQVWHRRELAPGPASPAAAPTQRVKPRSPPLPVSRGSVATITSVVILRAAGAGAYRRNQLTLMPPLQRRSNRNRRPGMAPAQPPASRRPARPVVPI